MKKFTSIAGVALAIALGACGGQTAANGGDGAETVNAEPDTSRNWEEVVSKTEEGGYRMGNPNAPIKVVEFGSMTCSHCAEFSETGFEPLVENYVKQGLVSYEMRNFVRDPLDLTVALLTRCAGAEPFFRITERMFANQADLFETLQNADQDQLQQLSTPQAAQSGAMFVGYAQAGGLIDFVGGMGISGDQARQCLTDPAGRQELETMRNQAVSQYSIPGTPAFLVNGELLQNATTWPQLEARLQDMIE